MIRCCIFDLDGTLLNTLDALTYTTNLTLKEFGYGPVDPEHIKQFVGDGYRMQMKRALMYSGDKELLHYEEALSAYTRLFAEHCLYHVRPYEGIPELLQELKARGIRIAVLSNKPHARTVENIEAVFGKGYFDIVAGQKDDVPKKPDPSGALKAAKICGADPSECLYFGDTNTDMKTGKNAKMTTVGVLWGFRGREELAAFQPEFLLEKPLDILTEIEK